MLKLSIECTMFQSTYSGCIARSSENIRSSSGGAPEKRKEGMKLSLPPKIAGKTSLGRSYFAW
jgi:hypothetical protein